MLAYTLARELRAEDLAEEMVETSRPVAVLAGMTDDQPKRGRPSDYSAQLAMSICDQLADGESLRAICSQDARQATVFRWIARHKALLP
jgi:hypothetical protein